MMSAAMSSRRSAQAFRISASTPSSARATSRRTSPVTGKRSAGVESLGQSNLGKYWVLRGSAVFVSDSV